MVLKTVSLTKRIGSDNWYYRRAIPADIQRILRDRTRDSRPQGWYRTHISISLRTPDRNVARTRGAVVAAHAERLIADLRGNIPALTVDAICGHAARTMGEVYRGVTVKKRMEAMAAFPRYNLTETAQAGAA